MSNGQITVQQCDPAGFYVGPTSADPDPMNEGNWLIPAGAVNQPLPPKPWGTKWPQWVGYKWKMVERK